MHSKTSKKPASKETSDYTSRSKHSGHNKPTQSTSISKGMASSSAPRPRRASTGSVDYKHLHAGSGSSSDELKTKAKGHTPRKSTLSEENVAGSDTASASASVKKTATKKAVSKKSGAKKAAGKKSAAKAPALDRVHVFPVPVVQERLKVATLDEAKAIGGDELSRLLKIANLPSTGKKELKANRFYAACRGQNYDVEKLKRAGWIFSIPTDPPVSEESIEPKREPKSRIGTI
jgi:hypothetical protein